MINYAGGNTKDLSQLRPILAQSSKQGLAALCLLVLPALGAIAPLPLTPLTALIAASPSKPTDTLECRFIEQKAQNPCAIPAPTTLTTPATFPIAPQP